MSKDRTRQSGYARTKDIQRWICPVCSTINTEYHPWPVNCECEKCGYAQEFGTAHYPEDEQ
jgi:hypothetical protein